MRQRRSRSPASAPASSEEALLSSAGFSSTDLERGGSAPPSKATLERGGPQERYTLSHEVHMGRILALDVGEKTIGVAMSDESETFAFPGKTILRQEGYRRD